MKMAVMNGVYKCEASGDIVEVVHAGNGELTCEGKPMKQLTENTVDAAKEKHVPVIEKKDNGYFVKIGSVPHPMEEKHYIEWIELLVDGRSYKQFLKPGMKAEAFFAVSGNSVTARELCNLHGLWSAKA
jgi:superoxide reductase